MTAEYYPLQVLLLTFAGWANREQTRTIEYLIEENRVLKEQLKARKLRLNDASIPEESWGARREGRRHNHLQFEALRRSC